MATEESIYSIGEFSDMTGLPQSKLRYYEKLGLFSVRRRKNGYRCYSPEDAFRVNAFRSLLVYGFSVEDAIRMLDERQDSAQFAQSLDAKKQDLLHQKQLLEYRLERLDNALATINLKPSEDFSIRDLDDLLFVRASRGRDFTVCSKASVILARFVEMLSISSYARLVSCDELAGGRTAIDPSYITAIPTSESWRLGDYPQDQVEHLALGKCLVFHRMLTREDSVKVESFSSMQAWLAGHGYRIRGSFVIFPSFLNLDGEGTDMETVVVPII